MPEAANAAGLSHEITDLERQTMARVARRLLPMLIACYFVAYLDRVNVGFASLTMNKALGFSSAVYGFGGGIFFLGYFIFEVPSNILLVESRRPRLDRAHPDHLGHHLRLHRPRHRAACHSIRSASCSGSPRRASSPASSST